MHSSDFRRNGLCALAFLALVALPARAQLADRLSLSVEPAILVPLAPSTEYFTVGGATELTTTFNLKRPSSLVLQGGLGLGFLPTRANIPSYTVAVSGGPGVVLDPIDFLRLSSSVRGGYYLGIFQNAVGGSLFLSARMGAEFRLSPRFSLGVGGVYQYLMDLPQPYYHGFGATVSLGLSLGDVRGRAIEFIELQIEPVFGSLHKYYDTAPFGMVRIRNTGDSTLTDVQVSFYVRDLMDRPKICAVFPELRQGEERMVPITALFNHSVLELNEATLVTAVVTASYTSIGDSHDQEHTASVRVHDPNALTWTDDRKAAAFVTTKDPLVLTLSKNVAGRLDSLGTATVNPNLDKAMALFEALGVAGIGYVIDPRTPYADFSKMASVIDYVQFPSQTLAYRAGDCDDLSILYVTLLESVGVETAFITVPGHIFTAFSLGIDQAAANRTFRSVQDLIFVDDTAWVPVETTVLRDGFLVAWSSGARQWREARQAGTAQFYPVHQAWNIYEPLNVTSAVGRVELPSTDVVMTRFHRSREQLVNREIQDRVAELESRITGSRSPERLINALGVLYARFGLYAQAEEQFRRGIAANDPSLLVNLANTLMLQNRHDEAFEHLTMARTLAPGDPVVLVAVARAASELGNQTAVREAYQQLERLDPELAGRYLHLVGQSDEGARASSAFGLEDTLWAEDESR